VADSLFSISVVDDLLPHAWGLVVVAALVVVCGWQWRLGGGGGSDSDDGGESRRLGFIFFYYFAKKFSESPRTLTTNVCRELEVQLTVKSFFPRNCLL
jgi:hypothetical protein